MAPRPVSDPLERFPDVVAALAATLSPVAPPPRLKERLDARLRDFARERDASFGLLSRPADRLREGILTPPEGKRRAKGRPLGRFVVSACGREAAFFCWYLAPRERYDLVLGYADGTAASRAGLETDGAGGGELPYLPLPPGPQVASVSLRRASSGQTVLAAHL